jgi:nicotinamide-nucleotide amidase
MKASLLAIGTELTTGQIVNKNGATLSQKLNSFGLEIVNHLVVPDDRAEILRALDYCSTSDLIFVTGGLGPTSDDFTREVITQWTKTELLFDETSWTHVCERLSSRGFTPKDIQRQQCFFPSGSQILDNSHGTANGFFLTHANYKHQPKIFVLPGPPREIDAIWSSFIKTWLEKNTQQIDKKITRSWDTIGVGESDVAQLVEKVFEGKKISSSNTQTETAALPFDIGYRVHLPYVEVKLTYPSSAGYTCELFVEKVDQVLSAITVMRDFTDVVNLVSKKIAKGEIAIYDFVSQGFLHHRLSSALKSHPNWMYKQGSEAMDSDFFVEERDFLALLPISEDQALLIANWGGHSLQKQLEAPMKSKLMNERRLQYFAEMALIEFSKNF